MTGEVHALVFLEFADNVTNDCVVPVVAAELGVPIGGKHFEDAIADFQHGDIEGTAAKVIDGDFFIGLLIEAVSQ